MRSSVVLVWMLVGCAGPSTDSGDDTDRASQAELLGIGLSPRDPAVSVGESVRFRVKAFYDDTSTLDVSDSVTWVSTEPRVASIDASGVALAVAPGVAGIVATDARGVATRTDLSVKGDADTPESVAIKPRIVELAVAEQVDLAAVATWADGSTGNVASRCTWTSDDVSVASVDASGVLAALAEGRTTVRAACAALSASAPVTVRAADSAPELPDLVVGEVLLEATGDSLLLVGEVRNDGVGMSPLAFVDVFLDSDGRPDGDDTFVTTEIVDALAPGEVTVLEWTIDDIETGLHEAWLVADADGWVEESDERNNASGPHPFEVGGRSGPQLVIDVFEAVTDGEYTLYSIEIRNAGDEAATDFWVDLWYDPAGDPGVCDTGDDFGWVSRLDPGKSAVWEPDVAAGPETAWLSVLYVDSCDDVAESDEDDNIEYTWVEE